MDMLYFSQTLKLVEKLCEQLKETELAKKVGRFLHEKESQDIFKQQN